MDLIDRNICGLLQSDGRATSAEIAKQVGLSVSAANERLKRLLTGDAIEAVQARLNPDRFSASFCCFIFIDLADEGEDAAVRTLSDCPEVQELHHVSGPHSYLAKVRVKDTAALQTFLKLTLKPLKAVTRTETIVSLQAEKETSTVTPGGGPD
ncbi:MAG: Lrp/AsnC family transcriptional regulator [Pseudomonadota bacterium]